MPTSELRKSSGGALLPKTTKLGQADPFTPPLSKRKRDASKEFATTRARLGTERYQLRNGADLIQPPQVLGTFAATGVR